MPLKVLNAFDYLQAEAKKSFVEGLPPQLEKFEKMVSNEGFALGNKVMLTKYW